MPTIRIKFYFANINTSYAPLYFDWLSHNSHFLPSILGVWVICKKSYKTIFNKIHYIKLLSTFKGKNENCCKFISYLHGKGQTLINILSDCISSYLKYLATGILSNDYKKEIENLSNNKVIRNSTRNILNPCVEDNDKTTIINGDVNFSHCNFFEIDKNKKERIQKKLQEIEQNLPIENYEQDMFGKILEIDAVRAEEHLSKSKLGFVIEGGTKPIEAAFSEEVDKEEIKNILFERIKINAVVSYRGEEAIKILIRSYNMTPLKNLKNFIS